MQASPELQRLHSIGLHGGRVLRPMNANGRDYKPGDEISAEITAKWPVTNRVRLGGGPVPRIRFYDPKFEAPAEVVVNPADIPEEQLDPTLGQFGAVTMATLSTGGTTFPPGIFIPADVVLGWRVQNRYAMQRTGRLAFFTEAPDAATMQRLMAAESSVVDDLLKE